ncbi:hypothetical protein BvCmsKSP014_05261 [Escherichia coli]|nr:hypothetical protein BvCmsKSP014_05261 [Escherichia coli]
MVIHAGISGGKSGRATAAVFHHKHHGLIPLSASTGQKNFRTRQGDADLPVLLGAFNVIKGFTIHTGDLHILDFQRVRCAGQYTTPEQQTNTPHHGGQKAADDFVIHH